MNFGMKMPAAAKDGENEDEEEAQSEEDDEETRASEEDEEERNEGNGHENWEGIGRPDTWSVRNQKNDGDLDGLLVHGEVNIPKPHQNGKITKWLKKIYKNSRGFELGTFDPALLSTVWKEQSTNWDAIAMGYIEDIISLVHRFTVELLSKICQDEHVRRGLNSALLEKLMERYKKSIDHTNFVLTVERYGTPMTSNHYFADSLGKSSVLFSLRNP